MCLREAEWRMVCLVEGLAPGSCTVSASGVEWLETGVGPCRLLSSPVRAMGLAPGVGARWTKSFLNNLATMRPDVSALPR